MNNRAPNLLLRSLTSMLVLLVLAAQICSVAHLAAVRHVRCAEHGELMEVAGDVSAAGLSESPKNSSTALQRDVVALHGHDHCALAAFASQRVGNSAAGSVATSGAFVLPAILPTQRHAPRRSLAILRFAPKSSPPFSV